MPLSISGEASSISSTRTLIFWPGAGGWYTEVLAPVLKDKGRYIAAGWDHLLPEWFTRLHPVRKTPVNSILFVGAMMLGVGLAGIVGVGEQEAFQLLQSGSIIFYGSTYLVMFALPVLTPVAIDDAAPPPMPISMPGPPSWMSSVPAVSGCLNACAALRLPKPPAIMIGLW